MSTDESLVHAKLRSAFYAALAQTASVVGPALRAQIAAVRIFKPLLLPVAHAVAVLDLPSLSSPDNEVFDWPAREASIFGLIQHRGQSDQILRLSEIISEEDQSAVDTLFAPVAEVASVVDAIVMTTPLPQGMWGMVALVRAGDHLPFSPEDLERVHRLKPDIRQALQDGWYHEAGGAPQPRREPTLAQRQTPEQLLAKMTRAERQIFHYLRERYTEREIASSIHRSPHTVHVHVKNIYRKMGVNSRRQLLDLFEQAEKQGASKGEA